MLALRHDDVRRSRAATASTIDDRAEDAARDHARSRPTQPIELSPTFMGAHEVPARVPRTAATTTCDLVIDEMIPAVARGGARGMVRRLLRDRRVHARRIDARSSRRARRRTEAAHPRRRARRERRLARRGRGRRALGRSSDLRRRRRHPRDCAAAGVVATLLPNAAFYLKLGRFAPARVLIDARRAGGAGDRRQSGRRLLAVDAVRDDPRLLRHGSDVRGGARRGDDQRRLLARSPRVASAASSPASRWTPSSSHGDAIDLIRVGTATIRAVVKRGRIVDDTEDGSHEDVKGGDVETAAWRDPSLVLVPV